MYPVRLLGSTDIRQCNFSQIFDLKSDLDVAESLRDKAIAFQRAHRREWCLFFLSFLFIFILERECVYACVGEI